MKVVIKSILLLTLWSTVSVNARETELSVLTKEPAAIMVKYGPAVESTHIRLSDAAGQILYSESYAAKQAYAKKMNLAQLSEGVYTVEIEDTLRIKTYTITKKGLELSLSFLKEENKPVFRQKEGMVFVNLLNLEGKRIRMKVYDASNRVVYQETVEAAPVVEKAFNFKNALRGEYTIEVLDGDTTYSELVVAD